MNIRHPIRKALFALILLVTGWATAASQGSLTTSSPTASLLIDSLRMAIRDSMRVQGVPGVSITVLREGQIVWSEGLGWADLEQRVAVTPLTRFRIGSVSKPLTTAALGVLMQARRIDVDAPVQQYVPGFPRKPWPISVRELATHTAGIRHYRGTEFLINSAYPSITASLAIFADDSLLFEPGTRFGYSSYGYNLLSAAIEGAAGTPFLSFIDSVVFRPLGMRHTGPDFVDSLVPFRARWYTGPADSVHNAPFVNNSYKWAGGGFLSTTEDLVRFGQSMSDNTLLSESVRSVLWTPLHFGAGAQRSSYGFGWIVQTDSAGRRRVAHGGGSMGGTAMLVLFPDQHVVVAMLANSDQPIVGMANSIADRFANVSGRRQ